MGLGRERVSLVLTASPRCFEYALGSTGTWLPYITGGLAVGEVKAWDALTPSSGQAFRAGWTVGAGIETLLAPNWTAKVEYLYMDLGSAQLFDVVPGVSETVSFKASLIRGGINYKLSGTDAPRAFVTKYVAARSVAFELRQIR